MPPSTAASYLGILPELGTAPGAEAILQQLQQLIQTEDPVTDSDDHDDAD
jgi:hypothetical protein